MLFTILMFFNLMTGKNRRELSDAVLKSVVLFVLFLYAITEVLSIFGACTQTGILCAWLVADICLLLKLLYGKQAGTAVCSFRDAIKGFFSGRYFFIRMSFLFFFCAMFIMAILTVPYNWDSMTYHLTRMAIWTQKSSVAHYPAVDSRELSTPPLTEFVMMNLYLFCGKRDILLNMVQFLSYVFNTYVIYRISRRLELDRLSSYFASVLFVSVPVAFAEAITTQVDEFATIWLMIFVYYGLGFIKGKTLATDRTGVENALVMGLSIGFGYLSKPTVIPAMMIFILWLFLCRLIRKEKTGDIIKFSAFTALSALAMVLPEVVKNFMSFGAILDPSTGQRQLVGTLRPDYVFINCLKNVAYDLANPYLYAFGYRMQKIVYWMASFLNVEINDPSISEDGKIFEMGFSQIYDHDSSTNVVIVTLILLMAALLIIRFIRSEKKKRFLENNMYSIVSFTAFIAMMMIVRWEPFMNRYMLPVFALCCPGIAAVTETGGEVGSGRYIRPIALFLCALELFSLFNYHGTILLGQMRMGERERAYYTKREEAFNQFEMIREYILEENPETVGMITSSGAFKYPVWGFLNRTGIEGLVIVPEEGMTGDGRQPDAIFVLGMKMGDSFDYAGREYKLVDSSGKANAIYR